MPRIAVLAVAASFRELGATAEGKKMDMTVRELVFQCDKHV